MAWKRCDDIDGSIDDVQPVQLAYGGGVYILHLGPASRDRLEKDLTPWLGPLTPQYPMPDMEDAKPAEHAVTPRRASTRKGRSPIREDLTEVRAWAAANNLPVRPVGRVPHDVLRQYDAAHAS